LECNMLGLSVPHVHLVLTQTFDWRDR